MKKPSAPLSGDPAAALRPADIERLTEFLYRRTGMSFNNDKRYYIDRRVEERIAETGSDNFATYFTLLRVDQAEVECLINAFTINETYFYREEHQLRCLSQSLLPELVKGKIPGAKIRIWSVPCSTGEEPFSIAIWLLENWPLVDAYNIEICGSDIDTDVLAAAKIGNFGVRALSRLSDAVVDSYFEPAQAGQRRIIADLQESVLFSRVNIVDAKSMARHGMFDVIFCRNVLIYFDESSRLEASHNLLMALNPGGFLCLGHTESMARINDRFDSRRFEDAIVYQRPPEAR